MDINQQPLTALKKVWKSGVDNQQNSEEPHAAGKSSQKGIMHTIKYEIIHQRQRGYKGERITVILNLN